MTKKPIDTKKYSEDELLKLLDAMHQLCEVENWCYETEQTYLQIVALIKKPEDYEKNLADCTEAIDILIEQHEELCDEREGLRKKPQVTEAWIKKKFDEMNLIYYYSDRLIKFRKILKEVGHGVAKPVTEEWIEEKADKIPELACREDMQDFIRSLIEEIK